jgi:hypothetical protein
MSKQQKKQSRKTRRQSRSRKMRGGDLFENPAPEAAPSAQKPGQEQPVTPVQEGQPPAPEKKSWLPSLWNIFGGKKSRKQSRK